MVIGGTDMLKAVINKIKSKREEKRKEHERLEYIQKRVLETGRDLHRNRSDNVENKEKSSKQYFYDSEVYGKVFNK